MNTFRGTFSTAGRGCIEFVVLFLQHCQGVAGKADLEEAGLAVVVSAAVVVAVGGEEGATVESTENHAVAVVGRCYWLLFLNPWSVEGSAFRVCHALGVDIVDPACPKHAEPTAGSAEKEGAVGNAIGAFLAFDYFAAPGRIGRTEENLALSDRRGEIRFEFNLFDCAIPVLEPLLAIYHIWFAVGVNPESTVERQLVGRKDEFV